MARPGERGQRTFIKLALGILIGVILISFLGWGGYRLYAVFESEHLARRAAGYLSGGDLRQASLSARRALQLNPSSISAIRVAAEAAERANDRSALGSRRKAVDLQPDSIEDKLALINCSLQFKEVAAAAKMLDQLDEKARYTAGFYAAAARLAEAKKDPAQVESEWAEAVRLAPENKSYQLEFASALLKIGNPARRANALATLEQLRSDEKQRAAATRALIIDGIKHRLGGQKLLGFAHELQKYPEATLGDQLLFLDLLRQLRDPEFTQHLTETERRAASNPADLAAILSWMNANGMALMALDLTHTLPGDVLKKWPVPLTIAESYDRLADWDKLQDFVKDKNWGPFDFLRHAYLSRAFREVGMAVMADREWNAAQKLAGSQTQFLSLLSQTVLGWGWEKESRDLLWRLSKQPEAQLEALEGLYREYAKAGDTPGLYRVLTRLGELTPGDNRIQNNLAQLRLLLNTDVEKARQAAADIYAREPANPAYASTYAFALYTEGGASEGLEVMNRLSPEELHKPTLAMYYGVLLAAAGDREKAREYLGLVDSARLLPEERELIAKAEESLKR